MFVQLIRTCPPLAILSPHILPHQSVACILQIHLQFPPQGFYLVAHVRLFTYDLWTINCTESKSGDKMKEEGKEKLTMIKGIQNS
jgi:hypothetical protein